jgi:putative tricarboxylic transport membrane protein
MRAGMRREWAFFGFVVLLAVGAAALTWIAWQIPVRPIDVLLGPRLFPVIIMATLSVLATLLAVPAAWRLLCGTPLPTPEEPPNWGAVAFVLGGLFLFGALVETAGFVIAAAALFVSVARGFGSASVLQDAAIGLLLSLIIFAVFNFALGLSLPAGSLFPMLTRTGA